MLILLREELVKRGIDEQQIIHLNFESLENSDKDKAELLYEFIKAKITNKERYYLLLDEIQEVDQWEKAVNSFFVDFNADIYITGSNSRMLSSELATYLAGRYVEISLNTLSFAEYLLFRRVRTGKEAEDIRKEFRGFLQVWRFPGSACCRLHRRDSGQIGVRHLFINHPARCCAAEQYQGCRTIGTCCQVCI